MSRINILWCRFQQCSSNFTMLLIEGSSETRFFRHLSDHVFGVRNFGNTKSLRDIFCSKIFKTHCTFQKCSKKLRKYFYFWDNCILICIVILPLLTTGYFSSAANVLRSCPKVLHVNKRDIFQLNWLWSFQWLWQMYCEEYLISAWARLPCFLSIGSLKQGFLDIYLTTFLESPNFVIRKYMRVMVLLKIFKISCRFWKCSQKFRKCFLFLR